MKVLLGALSRARRQGRGGGTAAAPSAPGSDGFSDGYDLYGLAGNEAFNPASPTLKDGTAVTGAMLDYLEAYEHWRDNQGTADAHWQIAGSSVLANTNAYLTSRRAQPVHDAVMRAFRMTGDLRDLDLLCAGFDALQAQLDADGGRIAWDGACSATGLIRSCCSGDGNPYSPYRKVNQSTEGGLGTDLDRLNQVKLWQLVAEFAWALHLNQAKTSPGSVDYGTRLTYWKARLLDFVKAWSETSTDCWATQNYRGCDAGSTTGISNLSQYRIRQAWGKYPFIMRNESHAGLNTILLHRYVGLLGVHASLGITNPADCLTASDQMVTAARNNGGYLACSNADHGASLVFPHNRPFSGTDPDPQRMTYVGYQGGSLISMWLTNAWRDVFTSADMVKIGAAISWGHDGTSGLTHANIVRTSAQCGLDAGGTGGRSASENSLRGMAALPLVFRPTGTKMGIIGEALMTLSGGATADRGAIPSALFLREALVSIGEL